MQKRKWEGSEGGKQMVEFKDIRCSGGLKVLSGVCCVVVLWLFLGGLTKTVAKIQV